MGGSLPVEKIVERLDWVVDDSFQCDVQPQGKNVYKTQFPNKMAEEEESREAASCVTYDRAPVVFFSSVGATHLAGRALQLDRETSVLLPQQGVRFRLRKSGMGLTRLLGWYLRVALCLVRFLPVRARDFFLRCFALPGLDYVCMCRSVNQMELADWRSDFFFIPSFFSYVHSLA
jgi:hypothetical protein